MTIELEQLDPETCDSCGLCCEGIGSPVLIYQTHRNHIGPHPFRPEGLPQPLINEIDETFGGLYRGQEPQERCLWFDPERRRCRHYEWRPQICRDYELGGTACLIRREEERANRQ
ncbi:YkgJ family cysteine cluster protein [Rubinisphaera margarita]|uniref:YkgJ family cysteine cluster protein n=1 Tax=Rubinisphaera margarita TaxID=2909586 RepID=UPI001EE8B058|nr:YkgJ family cysteine cluster protein [Rubinisphaera margarita]MCG6154546.1 YkgJ family cysteine cluster protein [Rubinisphaera margarita]